MLGEANTWTLASSVGSVVPECVPLRTGAAGRRPRAAADPASARRPGAAVAEPAATSEMPSQRSAPAGFKPASDALDRLRTAVSSVPLPVRIVLAVIGCVLLSPVIVACGLVYAPYAVWSGRRSVTATVAVALWGVVLI